jgi:hypothetical protein
MGDIKALLIAVGLVAGTAGWTHAQAQPAPAEPAIRLAQAGEPPPRPVRRVRPRIQIYPRATAPQVYRDCQAQLVQEWRPSGTVIVPRMRCVWVRD